MFNISKLLVGPAVAAAFLAAGLVGARAAEFPQESILSPAKGLSFDVGSKRAITYFQSAKGICNMTLLLADRVADEAGVPGAGSRLTMQVLPGKNARVDTAEGKSLEFGCKLGAQAMTVKAISQVAWSRSN